MFQRPSLKHPYLRGLVRTATQAAVRSAATAAGSAPVALAIWWITHR
ncbi:hypothetical protein [Streptomyces sp. NPDC021562]